MARRDLALRLRDARRADRRLETVAQFKQAMAAPDWEMDDYDWCVQTPACPGSDHLASDGVFHMCQAMKAIGEVCCPDSTSSKEESIGSVTCWCLVADSSVLPLLEPLCQKEYLFFANLRYVQSLSRRPTFLPSMKLKPPRAGWMEKDHRRGMLAAYLNALADLAGPKRALPMLRDVARIDAYSAAIRCAVRQRPGAQRS